MEIVYLFRQLGTNYVKIGMTSLSSCDERFQAFKTYSPLGAEIVGTIRTKNALKLERHLHKKYAHKRLNGEFFALDNNDIESILSSNSNKHSIEIMNIVKFLESSGDYSAIERILKFSEKMIANKNSIIDSNGASLNILDIVKKEFEECDFSFLTSTEVSDFINEKYGVETNSIGVGIILTKNFVKSRKRVGDKVKTVYNLCTRK